MFAPRSLVVLAALIPAIAARAACIPQPLGETSGVFVAALEKRVRPLGVTLIAPVGTIGDGGTMYLLDSAAPTLATFTRSGAFDEIGVTLSAPAGAADVKFQIEVAAFAMARYAAAPEAPVAARLSQEIDAHLDPGTFALHIGDVAAVMTRTPGALVIRLGRVVCRP